MFTGLIEEMGSLLEARRSSEECVLRIGNALPHGELSLGDSVAVNGACLTLTSVRPGAFEAQASQETLRRTNLGRLRPGDRVNLERAMRLGQRLDGHLVQGHVDGVGLLREVRREGSARHVRVGIPEGCEGLLVSKGSVTLDGISLTVNDLDDKTFEVTVVPWTARHVALVDRPMGWPINVEADILGKYVARLLGRAPAVSATEGVTMSLLARGGFLS